MQKTIKKSREAGSAHLLLIALVVLAGVAGCGYYVYSASHKAPVAATTQSGSTATTTASTMPDASSYSPPSLTASGTDNQTLNSDMQSINSSVGQDNQHVQATDQSFNDKSINITN